jgi:hypothetical protein
MFYNIVYGKMLDKLNLNTFIRLDHLLLSCVKKIIKVKYSNKNKEY